MEKEKLRYDTPVVVCLLLIALLLTVPTGFEDAVQYQEAQRCIAEVLSVDDSSIVDTGLVRSGEQRCIVEFTSGKFKGQTATAINLLQGSLELDKLYGAGDKAQVVVSCDGDTILRVSMIDHYRIPGVLLLAYKKAP